ncbi:MAG: ABC transporter substrate-binding protein [Pseudomonadota bacterium]
MRISQVSLIAGLLVAGCGNDPAIERPETATRPLRVVSLDLCADQYVLKLVDRERILAVSPDATAEFSYMREAARGVRVVRSIAEDVLVLKPDLVVRTYGGGPNATAFFERAGIPVLNVGWANDIPTVVAITESLASGLAEPERGAAVIADMRARLERLPMVSAEHSALYMTPAGVTTGPGSLVHEMLVAAGLANFQRQKGWQPIPLERLAYDSPDIVAAAFFDTQTSHPDGWSPMRHPVARAQISDQPVVALKGAWTACSGWYLLDAVEALAAKAAQ